MNDYDKTWQIVEAMARTKLLMNDHKGRIEAINPGKLLTLAQREINELRDAIARDNYMNVIEEAADILNFITAAAHQVIYKYRTRYEHTRQIETANDEALDHRADINQSECGGSQLGSGDNSTGDSKEDGSTPISDVPRDPTRNIPRPGGSGDGGHADPNKRENW